MDSLSLIPDQDDRRHEEQGKMCFESSRDNKLPLRPDNVHKKRRSHSRGNSITSLDEILKPTSMIPSPPRSRPSSHHRRQSSLSSRHASAEIMGVALPDDDKSSVPDHSRLYALLALEGKNPSPITSSFGFSKVELPDLSAAAAEPRLDLAAASGTGMPRTGSLSSNNSFTGKRESFGKLLTPASSCSSKKELHTLLEENEGDDEEVTLDELQYVPPAPSPLPQRHRPASLKLRPLSLRSAAALPTPSPTPPMRNSTKLKSLTLAPGANIAQATALGPPKRSSAVFPGGSPMLSLIELDTSLQRSNSVGRRNLDSARPGILTPDASSSSLAPSPSPRFDALRRSPSPGRSSASSPDDAHTAYLTQSHASLLARIAELENALTIRDDRAEPALSEELLEMLADLKTERDNLKKELDDAHAKTAEHEKQAAILSRRVDNERREVWVTKEKLAIAEAASKVIEEERDELRARVDKLNDILSALKNDLLRERKEKAKVDAELREMLRTPKVTDLTVRMSKTSTDSQATNVGASSLEASVERIPKNADMRAVPEEDEGHYEDALSDGSSHSRSASFAFGGCSPTSGYVTEGSTYQPYQIPRRQDTLNNEWSFVNAASALRKREPKNEVDLFFTCLENLDCDEPGYVKPLVEVQTPKRQPKVLGLGFGFDLLEDEDPNFNFGLPVDDQSSNFHQLKQEGSSEDVAFATQMDTDDDEVSGPPAPLPLLDDEDSAFSFAASQDSSVTSRSPSPDLDETGLVTPRLTPPQWRGIPDVFTASPSAERQYTRARSRVARGSIDLSSTSWTFPKSAPPNIVTFPQGKPQAPSSALAPVPIIPTTVNASNLASPPKKPYSFGRNTVAPNPAVPSRANSAPNPRLPVILSPLSPAPLSPLQRPYVWDGRSQPSTPTSKSTQTPKSGLFANLASLLPSSWSSRSQREFPPPLASPKT